MAEEPKVYTNEEQSDSPFPIDPAQAVVVSEQPQSGETISTSITSGGGFPVKKIATELLSTSLNTHSRKILQEFQLQQSGAIKVGDFKQGETGEISITPNGVVAKNLSGITTFALDGDTGDAIFSGTVQAGTNIAGAVVSGDIQVQDAGTLSLNSGADLIFDATATDQGEIVFYSEDQDRINNKIYLDTSASYFYIEPESNDWSGLKLGNTTKKFTDVWIHSIDGVFMSSEDLSATNKMDIYLESTQATFYYNGAAKARINYLGDLYLTGTVHEGWIP